MTQENDIITRLQSDLNHIRAAQILHNADLASLLHLLSKLLRATGADRDATATFLRLRRLIAEKQLTSIEDSNPQLAAQLQHILDNPCSNFPLSDFTE
jgi:glutamine synthetase adenylyltransferase